MHPKTNVRSIQDMFYEAGYRVEKSVSGFVCFHAYESTDMTWTKSVSSSAAESCEVFDSGQNRFGRRT